MSSAEPGSTRPGISIVSRTRLAVAGVATVVMLLAFAVFYLAWLSYALDMHTAQLGRQTVVIARGVETGAAELSDAATPTGQLRRNLFRVQARLISAHLSVTDANGTVLFSSDTTPSASAYHISSLKPTGTDGVRSAVVRGDGGRWTVLAAPLSGNTGYVVAVQSFAEARDTQWPALGLVALCALLAIILGWFVGGLVARRLTARVLRLNGAAHDVAEGDWGRQVQVEGGDEIASLARSFNEMSTRVAAAYGAQREFVGNVSHELRTPITSIQGYATALLDIGLMIDDAERRRFLEVIRDESARLGDLTHTLLALADIDAGRLALSRTAIDTDVVADVLQNRHAAAAVEHGVVLDVDHLGCDGARPAGDEARLLEVATALVNNAIAHTPAGGTVRVSARCEDDQWILQVDDAGPGVAVAERERIFERFVRLDPSRSSRTGGSGLGLAISARLVHLMGGEIGVTDGSLGGARFWVSLPVARQADGN